MAFKLIKERLAYLIKVVESIFSFMNRAWFWHDYFSYFVLLKTLRYQNGHAHAPHLIDLPNKSRTSEFNFKRRNTLATLARDLLTTAATASWIIANSSNNRCKAKASYFFNQRLAIATSATDELLQILLKCCEGLAG